MSQINIKCTAIIAAISKEVGLEYYEIFEKSVNI
jgi:hypothetical protein